MRVVEKFITNYFERMSQAEKEALLDHALDSFLRAMTPAEKQHLIEKTLLKLLEGVEMKDVLPRVLAAMWKRVKTDEERRNLLNSMVRMVSQTGGKISDLLPEKIKNLIGS